MKFEASLENLHSILHWILEELKGANLDRNSLHKIELASEEAIVNICKHGRSDWIEVEVKIKSSLCEVIIKDQGPAFNPLTWKGSDVLSSLDEREEGGLGIHFILNSMDDVRYKREKNQNILMLMKKRSTHFSSQKR